MSACCNAAVCKTSWGPRIREVIAWLVPSAILALIPKCPLCLAAYVAVWTGIGLSFTAATYLRWTLLFLCIALLLYLIVKRLDRLGAIFGFFRKETQSCHTKS